MRGKTRKREIAKIAKKYSADKSFLATEHFLSLASGDDPSADPILKQVIPFEDERTDDSRFVDDPLCEERFSPLPRLVRRYKDRALIRCTNICFIHCRFCFRKRLWISGCRDWKITDDEFANIARYIRSQPKIKDVILSGGDPLCIEDKNIFMMLKKLQSIDTVDVVRIGSRALSAAPDRVDASFVDGLKKNSSKIWFMSHFNHPDELSGDAKIAISRLVSGGIPVLNQTVLLKGINDNASILADLFRKLVSVKVKPHYLFHVDPAKGNKKFATGVDKGLSVIKQLRENLSSICVPDFALDLPEGGGKIILNPEFRKGRTRYANYEGKIFEYF